MQGRTVRVSTLLELKTYMHGWLSGRTNRASLHASCQQSILIIRRILKVKVQWSKFKAKIPTFASTINVFTRFLSTGQLYPLLKRLEKPLGRVEMGLKVQERPANKQSKCIKLLQ